MYCGRIKQSLSGKDLRLKKAFYNLSSIRPISGSELTIKEQQISKRVNFNTESTEKAQRTQRISDTKGLSEA